MAAPPLPEKPGSNDNWVDRAGGLPRYIDRIARHLHHDKGMPVGRAIAIAVNVVKKMCASGDLNFKGRQSANAGSRAEACAAVAQWEKMKAKTHAQEAAWVGEVERTPIPKGVGVAEAWRIAEAADVADVERRRPLVEAEVQALLDAVDDGMALAEAATMLRGRGGASMASGPRGRGGGALRVWDESWVIRNRIGQFAEWVKAIPAGGVGRLGRSGATVRREDDGSLTVVDGRGNVVAERVSRLEDVADAAERARKADDAAPALGPEGKPAERAARASDGEARFWTVRSVVVDKDTNMPMTLTSETKARSEQQASEKVRKALEAHPAIKSVTRIVKAQPSDNFRADESPNAPDQGQVSLDDLMPKAADERSKIQKMPAGATRHAEFQAVGPGMRMMLDDGSWGTVLSRPNGSWDRGKMRVLFQPDGGQASDVYRGATEVVWLQGSPLYAKHLRKGDRFLDWSGREHEVLSNPQQSASGSVKAKVRPVGGGATREESWGAFDSVTPQFGEPTLEDVGALYAQASRPSTPGQRKHAESAGERLKVMGAPHPSMMRSHYDAPPEAIAAAAQRSVAAMSDEERRAAYSDWAAHSGFRRDRAALARLADRIGVGGDVDTSTVDVMVRALGNALAAAIPQGQMRAPQVRAPQMERGPARPGLVPEATPKAKKADVDALRGLAVGASADFGGVSVVRTDAGFEVKHRGFSAVAAGESEAAQVIATLRRDEGRRSARRRDPVAALDDVLAGRASESQAMTDEHEGRRRADRERQNAKVDAIIDRAKRGGGRDPVAALDEILAANPPGEVSNDARFAILADVFGVSRDDMQPGAPAPATGVSPIRLRRLQRETVRMNAALDAERETRGQALDDRVRAIALALADVDGVEPVGRRWDARERDARAILRRVAA